jgi:hypothetical protein
MQVGEVGVEIRWYANPLAPATPVDLTGAAVTLKIENPAQQTAEVTATVSPAGDYASYWTQAADFTLPGRHWLALFATLPGGAKLKSRVKKIVVGRSL